MHSQRYSRNCCFGFEGFLMDYIGHKMSRKDIFKRVMAFWDLNNIFPVPIEPISCPVCRMEDVIIKSWNFFRRPSIKPSFRCDVAFKCTYCSNVWHHGIPITAKQYKAGWMRRWTWREARERLEEIHNTSSQSDEG